MTSKTTMKTVEEYLALPYTFTIRWNVDDDLFVARVKEVDGCTGHGATEAEALAMVRENLREWIDFSLESGDSIPVPATQTHLPSGKWLQRVPRSLHAELVAIAEEENVSLNQFVTAALAKAIGARHSRQNVIDVMSGAAPVVADPWSGLAHPQVARWQIVSNKASQSSEFFFVEKLLGNPPPPNQAEVQRIKSYGKDDKNHWN